MSRSSNIECGLRISGFYFAHNPTSEQELSPKSGSEARSTPPSITFFQKGFPIHANPIPFLFG
jgi:hypothetical protein